MNTFTYDTIFILKPGETIPTNAVTEALEAANFDAQIRINHRPPMDDVYREVMGSFHTSGLMPNRPREEKVARFGVAWFTDERGRKHVRMIADIKRVKYHESNVIWPKEILIPNLVYPALAITVKGNVVTCSCGREGSVGDMRWDGKKCLECQEADRYEQETGFQQYIPTSARIPRRNK